MRQKADNYIGKLNCELFKPYDWEKQIEIASINMNLCDETIDKLKQIQKKIENE